MKIRKIILLIFCLFCFSLCFASKTDVLAVNENREVLHVYSSNFWEDFYFNENLLGESGKSYIVRFEEDIDLKVNKALYKKYIQLKTSGEVDGLERSGTFTACIDGNNKTILNFYPNSELLSPPDEFKLFDKLDGVKITNLTIKDCMFSASNKAYAFCKEANDCIFENVKIDNVVVYADETFGFAENLVNCYFINIDIDVDATASIKCYEFAKDFEDCGFKDNLVETTLNSLSSGEFVASAEINAIWTGETEARFLTLSGMFNVSTQEEEQDVSAETETHIEEAEVSTATDTQGKVQNTFNDVGFVLCGVSFMLVIAKNFAIMLTKKK